MVTTDSRCLIKHSLDERIFIVVEQFFSMELL